MELGEPIESPGQMTYGSQAAAASHVFEQQRDLALRERSKTELRRVDAALRKVADGTYGRCDGCGLPIVNVVAFVLILLSIVPVWLAQRISGAETAGARL